MKRRLRIYALGFVGVTGAYLVLAVFLATAVNPWGVFHAPWAFHGLDPYREIGDHVRIGKVGMIQPKADWEVAILGTSRMEIGMNPRHRVFAGRKAVNLGMAGSSVLENVRLCRYLMARDASLKVVIFGVDPGDLCTDFDSRLATDFADSRLADAGFSLERELGYLANPRMVEESFMLLANAAKGKRGERDDLGFWNNFSIAADVRALVTVYAPKFFKDVADAWGQHPQTPRVEKVELLRGLLADLKMRRIRVMLVYPPAHALLMTHPSANNPDVAPRATDRRVLAGLSDAVNQAVPAGPAVEFWDFHSPVGPVTEPLPAAGAADQRFPHWFDLVHFNAEIGSLMLERMFAAADDPGDETRFGVRVSGATVEEHLEAVRRAHAAYCESHPGDVAWVRTLLAGIKH